MNCPHCDRQLDTLVRVLSPVEQCDEVRVLNEDEEDGIRGEFTGEMQIRQNDGTQQWVECPHCGHNLADVTADGLEFVHTPTPCCETMRLAEPSTARGRNGGFRPTEIAVRRNESQGTIYISVRSSREYADLPPIFVNLSGGDTEALLRIVERQMVALCTARGDGKPWAGGLDKGSG